LRPKEVFTVSEEYDVLLLDETGEYTWIGAAFSVDDAIHLMKARASKKTARFCLYSHGTRRKLFYEVNGSQVSVTSD
jgi:hypothetical protein